MSRSTVRDWSLPPGAHALPDPEVRLAEAGERLDLGAIFARKAPVVVEVGFGKGLFLLEEAARQPETSFLGIETSGPYLRLVRFRTLRARLENVRLLRASAADVFARLMPPASLGAVFVLFPDPWPKRRHVRRRVVQAPFLADVARALEPGGTLHVATDHADYALHIDRVAAAVAALDPLPEFVLGDELARRTHYASKLARRGARFHARSWSRRP